MSKANSRFDALDTLRCLAVLVMVQGHAFYLVVDDSVRNASWYGWHNYLHGYTAPAFLFGAGLAFGVTTLRALPAHAAWGPTLFKRVYRYLALFAIGYAIQLPPLHQDPATWTAASLRIFSRVEALQHIGAVLLFAQGLVVLFRRRIPVVAVATLAGAAVVLIGPWMSRLPPGALGPQGVAAYLSADAGSTFPLVPWAGFVLLGITVAAVLPKSALQGPSLRIAGGFTAAGLGLVGLSLALDRLAPGAFGEHFYWKSSPYFFVRRLGWVLVMLGTFAGVDCLLALRRRAPGPVRRWVRLLSQQSLVAYVAHLAILYGSPFNNGIGRQYGRALDVVAASLLVLAMCVGLTLLASAWTRLERSFDAPFLFARRTAVAVMAMLVATAGLRASLAVSEQPEVIARGAVPADNTYGAVADAVNAVVAQPARVAVEPVVVVAPVLELDPGRGVEVATPAVGSPSVASASVLR